METLTEIIIYTDKDFNPSAIYINPNYQFHKKEKDKFDESDATTSTCISDTGW
jgi:hypothetical protein